MRIWGETAGMDGHLRVDTETSTVDEDNPNEFTSNGRERESQLSTSCHPRRLSGAGLGCISSNCWPKGFHGNSPNKLAVARVISCSLQTDSQAPFAEDNIPTAHSTQRSRAGACGEPHLCGLVSLVVCVGPLQATEREM